MKVPLAIALTGSIIYILCVIITAIPSGVSLLSYLFHGIDIMKITSSNALSVGRVLAGLVEIFVLGYFTGWLYATLLGKKK